jgi:hypothetical protein
MCCRGRKKGLRWESTWISFLERWALATKDTKVHEAKTGDHGG